MGSPLVGQGIMCSTQFFSYGIIKNLIAGDSGRQLQGSDFWKAGALVGVSNSFVDTPVDLFKAKMQSQVATTNNMRYIFYIF